MLKNHHLNKILLPILIFSIFFLNGCSKKEVIKPGIRATEKWQALIEQDWKKAYSYQSPSYRKNYTVKEFRLGFGQSVEWKGIEHNSTTLLNDKTAEVTLTLVVSFQTSSAVMDLPSRFKERWQLINGTWWHINN